MKPSRHPNLPSRLPTTSGSAILLRDVRDLILIAREQVARTVNAGLVLLYWQIGRRIRKDILLEKRAAYGEQILSSLGTQLTSEFGRGFSARNLASMVRCAEVFPDPKILQALTAKLSWTHLVRIIYLDDPLKRDFYAEMCRIEEWSTRTLEKKIDGMLFERTALSRKPARLAEMELKQLREQDRLTPDLVFRDPYLLDFLGLKDNLSWLRKHEQAAGEEGPLGIILCAGKEQEHVELLEMHKSGIHVATYLTTVVPKAELERKLSRSGPTGAPSPGLFAGISF